ncbi:hypothetical protein GC173_01955 [bacterium]|nr:hypothetical protein [bacterium]
MHGHAIKHVEDPGPARISPAIQYGLLGIGIVGLLVFLYGAFTGTEASRYNAWNGMMVAASYFWFLSMGAAAFLAIQYVVGAKWFITVKRLPEALAAFSYKGGFVFPIIIAVLAVTTLYSGARPGTDYPYEGTVKAFWLSAPVQTAKMIVYTGILAAATFVLVGASRKSAGRDAAGLRTYREKVSIAFLIVFTFVFSFWGWEILMSLEPKWFSTMWGVYCFSGGFVSALSTMMLLSFWLRSKYPGYLAEKRQLYDMGTYVMGFSTFFVYIGFSQFMLIWYANIPDETFFYLKRYEHGWLLFTLAIPVLKWLIPFFVLMPPKCRTSILAHVIVAACILGGQYVDLWWTVGPVDAEQAQTYLWPSFVNIMTFIGVGGVFGWSVTHSLASEASIVPVEDPDLISSINGEYLHA